MNTVRNVVRERLVEVRRRRSPDDGTRSAESIAREAYNSSRIEGCEVDYTRLLEVARTLRDGTLDHEQ
jgi:hypothetical protein